MADDQLTQHLLKKASETDHAFIPKSLATAASQFLLSSGVGVWAVKTVAEIKTLLVAAGLVPSSRTVNGHALTGNVEVTLEDMGGEAEGATAAHAELTEAHGATGAVVGTSNAQTLTNKRFGGEVDYSEFEGDGTLVAHGAATTFEDINKSLLPLSTGANVPSIIAVNGAAYLKVRAFGGAGAVNELGEGCEILHGYKQGTDIQPHLHWAATTADAGDVKWNLAYMWVNRDEVFAGEVVISVVVAASGVAWKEQRTNFPAISGAGKNIGSRFHFVLFRDPSAGPDNYTHDAAAFDFGLHYEKDTQGSRQITAK